MKVFRSLRPLKSQWDIPADAKVNRCSYQTTISTHSPFQFVLGSFLLKEPLANPPLRLFWTAEEKVAAEYENHGEVSVEQSKYLGGQPGDVSDSFFFNRDVSKEPRTADFWFGRSPKTNMTGPCSLLRRRLGAHTLGERFGLCPLEQGACRAE